MSQPVPQGGGPGAQANSLALYDPKKFNVLVPTASLQLQVSEWHKLSISEVFVDSNPDTSADIYEVGDRGRGDSAVTLYALAKPALNKLANAAGIRYSFAHSGVIVDEPRRIVYVAVGGITLPDGTPQPLKAEKEIDIDIIEEELRDAALKKVRYGIWGDGVEGAYPGGMWKEVSFKGKTNRRYFLSDAMIERYVDDTVRPQLLQWRKNRRMRAETGAFERLIRQALSIKSQYTLEELRRPFVVPRVDFSPDLGDPLVRQFMLQHGARDTAALFGGQGGQAARLISGSEPVAEPRPALPSSHPLTGDGPIVEAGAVDMQLQTPPAPRYATAADAGDRMPWETSDGQAEGDSRCADCKNPIEGFTHRGTTYDAPTIAEMTTKKFGVQLCWTCAGKREKAAKAGGQ